MLSRPKVAFVQDALPAFGGAEKVLEAALEIFPEAPIYTLIYQPAAFTHSPIGEKEIITSFIDRLPGGRAGYRAFLPLMPYAIEQFDFSGYDVVVSFSYAVAHGIRVKPGQLHISYTHTPLRYAWQQKAAFAAKQSWIFRWATHLFFQRFRAWDVAAAARADQIVTISNWMAECIWSAYRREAQVLYPPVDVDIFKPRPPRKAYYITVSRLVPHKRIDLIVEAFNRIGLPLVIVGEGPEYKRLARMAKPNITLLGWQPQEIIAGLLGEARGFIQASEEDFGIAMVEAQAAGCPVIALNQGASREIIRDGITGEFFDQQNSLSLATAVQQFESHYLEFDPKLIRSNAERFHRSRFTEGFAGLIDESWSRFLQRQQISAPMTAPSWIPLQRQEEGPYAG